MLFSKKKQGKEGQGRFLEKRCRRFRFPVPVRFMGHPAEKSKFHLRGLLSRAKLYTPPPTPFLAIRHSSGDQQLKKGSLGRGRSGTSAQSFVLCFLCSEVIFSCRSHRNFFQKLPLQCRHFLENPLAKNPKTQLLRGGGWGCVF